MSEFLNKSLYHLLIYISVGLLVISSIFYRGYINFSTNKIVKNTMITIDDL